MVGPVYPVKKCVMRITYVVNCADGDVEVLKQDFEELHILNFKWEDSDDQIILDDQNKNIGEIVKYIRRAEKAGKQAIILSRKGESRSMCVAAAALMKMNNWSLQKALQWMESKQGVKEKMRIRPSFMGQLKAYEQRLFASSSKRNKPTKSWAVAEAVPRGSNAQNSEQVVLRNTFVNQRESGRRSTPAKQRQQATHQHTKVRSLSRGKRVSWGDGASSEDEPTVCQRKRLEDGSERHCRLRNKRKGAQPGGVVSPSKGILKKVVAFEGAGACTKNKRRLLHEKKHREEGREPLKKEKETQEARKAGRKVRKEDPKAAKSSSHAR
uniref:Tyrosine-protein phosphatase domain-containing protein n=1 Tax=Chromera velia CCMP2878 TaxID=1169474 RepID=A0A0G4FA48_9ALVE|eukprot:Cvel_16006.t1-p1 / transcript=Cvel_16006.t1 / gene=Cvel_16006 / organism=Chromera_velia_CCMP2878 / gene_product=hypothetical protein / transcript_product=hypothetical protein / location=Cvel_scaffold1214:5277-9569(-) / protein_length=324 / sequence_SO=supercontig / SO=protein_coding / is_pseudo=false